MLRGWWVYNASNRSRSVLALARKSPTRKGPQLSPRKAPTQARARATVEAILRASARILTKRGFDGLSTNAVAQLAGVSVGSLYQYFPSKEALIRALVEAHLAELEKILTPDPSLLGQPLEVLARMLVKAMLEAHALDPALHRELLAAGEKVGVPQKEFIRAKGDVLVRALLEFYAAEVRPLDVELATFIIVGAMEGMELRITSERPEWLTDERVVDELTTLLLRYVGHTSVTGTGRRASS